MTYGAKGLKWRVRILFKDKAPEQVVYAFSRAKADRIGQQWLRQTTVKAVEIAEIRKTEVTTPLIWWDNP